MVPLTLTCSSCIIISRSTQGFPTHLYSLSCFSIAWISNYWTHHRQVDVGGIQLQVDLPVDCSLAVLVEVLSHLRTHCSETANTHDSKLFNSHVRNIRHGCKSVQYNNLSRHNRFAFVNKQKINQYFDNQLIIQIYLSRKTLCGLSFSDMWCCCFSVWYHRWIKNWIVGLTKTNFKWKCDFFLDILQSKEVIKLNQ